ncbi:MAG: hypothetical protein JWO38_7440 [Gemmataceae bacterium]|nr:hypothetical protein [Gemmataceae bacterium]
MAADRPSNGPRLPIGLMVIGSEMAGFTVLGVILDLLVFGTLPWLTIGLTVLGFAAAFYHLVLLTRGKTKPPASPPPPGRPR